MTQIMTQIATQNGARTWPTTANKINIRLLKLFAHKRYFYLEAQSFTLDGHPEIFLWVWFLGLYLTHFRINLIRYVHTYVYQAQ